jgi:hypothetical protein
VNRIIFGILILMVLLLGTQQASGDTISLTYLSGGVSSFVNIDGGDPGVNLSQYGTNSAQVSGQISGIGNTAATAQAGTTNSGGYSVSFSTQAACFLNGNYTGAQCHTTGSNGQLGGFIFLQVTGDAGNSGQIQYASFSNFFINVYPQWESNGGYPPFVITLNDVTMVNSNASLPAGVGWGFLDVAVGDIIGLSFGLLADNLAYDGSNPVGNMSAYLHVNLEPVNSVPADSGDPVPIPGSLILLSSGLFGLIGFRKLGRRG